MDLNNFLLNQKEFRSLTPDILLTQTYPQCYFIKVFNTFPRDRKIQQRIYILYFRTASIKKSRQPNISLVSSL